MKSYTLNLKGTKKNNTSDVIITIYGENKSQAFNWAYLFFQKGEETQKMANYIPQLNTLNCYKGKYFVPRSAVKINVK
jgi:hypothetical protein